MANGEGRKNIPVFDNIFGVIELVTMPVKLYTNLPKVIVLYRSLPDGVSATIG